MNSFLTAAAIAALLGAASLGPASTLTYAHKWYPAECCGGHDCAPANAIVLDRMGNMTVAVGDHRIKIPAGFVLRESPDSRIHICFQTLIDEMDGSPLIVPNCLFLPAQS
jgi:hypothetical protein